MRTEFFWLLSLCGFAAVSLICGLVAWPQLAAVWPSIQEKIDSFRRLPPLAKLVLLVFVGVFIVYGGTKPIPGVLTNDTLSVGIISSTREQSVVRDLNVLEPQGLVIFVR